MSNDPKLSPSAQELARWLAETEFKIGEMLLMAKSDGARFYEEAALKCGIITPESAMIVREYLMQRAAKALADAGVPAMHHADVKNARMDNEIKSDGKIGPPWPTVKVGEPEEE